MIRYLLDTDICIEIIRGKSSQTLVRLGELSAGSLAISSITLAELLFGAAKSSDPSKNRAAVAHFIVPFDVLPFENDAANSYGLLRAELERSGTPVGAMDMLFAAQAMAENLVLVTNNLREFTRIAGLAVETWGGKE